MLKKMLAVLAIVALFASSGCLTTNWEHNKRHFMLFREELRELHADIDRTFFGLEPRPIEVEE